MYAPFFQNARDEQAIFLKKNNDVSVAKWSRMDLDLIAVVSVPLKMTKGAQIP
jgi:hypothetical protein